MPFLFKRKILFLSCHGCQIRKVGDYQIIANLVLWLKPIYNRQACLLRKEEKTKGGGLTRDCWGSSPYYTWLQGTLLDRFCRCTKGEWQCRRGSGPFKEVLTPAIELGGSDKPFNRSNNWGRKCRHLKIVCSKDQICRINLPKKLTSNLLIDSSFQYN